LFGLLCRLQIIDQTRQHLKEIVMAIGFNMNEGKGEETSITLWYSGLPGGI
jgi:hypothetical protein